jgi:hypothetical protein
VARGREHCTKPSWFIGVNVAAGNARGRWGAQSSQWITTSQSLRVTHRVL